MILHLTLALLLLPLLLSTSLARQQPTQRFQDPRLPLAPVPPEVRILPPPGGQFSLGEQLRAEQRQREVERDLQVTERLLHSGDMDAQRLRDLGILRGEQQHLRQQLGR